MENGKKISLTSVIIALLLMAILVVLIWIGIALMNSDEKEEATNSGVTVKNEDTNSEEVVNNEKENSLLSMNLDELVYDAEYDKMTETKSYKVYTLVNKNGTWDYDYDNPVTIRLSDVQYPYININSADAEKANAEIKELYMEYEENYKNMENYLRDDGALYVGDYRGNVIIDWDIYNAYKYKNILSVVMLEPADIDTDYEIFSYTTAWIFNLDTKEYMSFEEMCKELGYNETELRQKIETQVQNKLNEYTDTDNNDWNLDEALQMTMENYDNTQKYFVDNSGNLNVIIDTIVPFQKEHYDFIYTIK